MQSQPQSFLAGLLEGRQQAIGLQRSGDLGGVRESFQLRRRQPARASTSAAKVRAAAGCSRSS